MVAVGPPGEGGWRPASPGRGIHRRKPGPGRVVRAQRRADLRAILRVALRAELVLAILFSFISFVSRLLV